MATQTHRFSVESLSCASCVRRLETALHDVPGIREARVNLASGTATVTGEASLSLEGVLTAARNAGYPMAQEADETPLKNNLARQTLLAAVLVLPVFILEMGGHIIPAFHHFIGETIGHQASRIFQFLAVGLTLAGPGRQFFAKGVPALLRGAPEMNSLVALGTFAAFAYSTVATFLPGLLPEGTRNVYFEAAGVIVVLILFGRTLEEKAKGRAGEAIKSLIALRPETAIRVKDGVAEERHVAELAVGDVIRVRPGERIPVDGVVIQGDSLIDEAMLTGEPEPVSKSKGETVTGGTISLDGGFEMRAERVGSDTVLARIVEMVQDAQNTKLPVENLVDRITHWFVPAVIATAILATLIWLFVAPEFALVAGVSVLIIACPCAMGLAVPVSIMVGMGRAAELGILFRQGHALQRLSDVKIAAFDKTGTLTEGHPALCHVETSSGFTRDQVLSHAAAVEALSEHPIGRAIVAEVSDAPSASNFKALSGLGVSGDVGGVSVAVGSETMMREIGADPSALLRVAREHASLGETTFFVAIGGELAGVITVSDPLRNTTEETVNTLRATGVQPAMITGDRSETAKAVATRLGITRTVANALPDTKVAAIKDMTGEGPVAFIGDGINDAPALAAADVGIAIGTGTDVAIETGDVVLMSGSPEGVPRAILLSRDVMRNIKQNLAWAFGYNILLIPVAAGVLYPAFGILLSPMLAAGAMALSSVAVVGNALRLRHATGSK